MPKIEFDVDEGLSPVQGIAVVLSIDEDGDEIITATNYGDMHAYQVVGLLQGALDNARDQLSEQWLPTEDEE